MSGTTRQALRTTLTKAKTRLDAREPPDRILTINAWNPWTQDSYLDPNTVNGMAIWKPSRRCSGKPANHPCHARSMLVTWPLDGHRRNFAADPAQGKRESPAGRPVIDRLSDHARYHKERRATA